jgi:hypothetical protein
VFLFLRVANWDNGELRCKLVDFDEFAMPLEKCNRTQGWALVCRRVRKEGHYHLSYHRVGNELTCLMAIEPGDRHVAAGQLGGLENPPRWVRCLQNRGTTINVYRDFMNLVCPDIEQNHVMPTDIHRICYWTMWQQTILNCPTSPLDAKVRTD